MTDLWALERLFRDAWPALEEHEADGWLARLTGGDTRRPNAINPLGPEPGSPLAALQAFRGHYDRARLRPLFRLPDFCRAADAELAAAGWESEGRTRTIAARLGAAALPIDAGLRLSGGPTAEWIAARTGPGGDAATQALLARLKLPAAFAVIRREGRVAALGFAVFAAGFTVIESIRTIPQFRRQGLATLCMKALLGAGREAGAELACLQVDAANRAGLALYAGLGFDLHLYDYHYRVPA